MFVDELAKLGGGEGLNLLVGGEAGEVANKEIPYSVVHLFPFDALATKTSADS